MIGDKDDTVVIGTNPGPEHLRFVENELSKIDEIIINDGVKKGYQLDTIFNNVSDTRINNGKPRVTMTAVREYFELIQKQNKKKVKCAFSGIDASSLIIVSFDIDGKTIGEFTIPVADTLLYEIKTEVIKVEIDNEDETYLSSLPKFSVK